ncbi:MAG: helix-turn-helix domain-containing protein [Thermomicrobiales bacterium]|nr:helix-turn-helix domain-containing protein [Thermomicrobiales bacterium]MCO5220626.1 helix-turn-helix domain-containing protein [Thermomicrobiales bacterium]
MSPSNQAQLGELLRTYRVRAGLSQEALAEASGVSARTISDLERGQRSSAHLETMRMLGAALGLSDDNFQRFLTSARPDIRPEDGRPDELPPRIGPGSWSASLPGRRAPLVGRETDVTRLVDLIQPASGQILTLTGPGGVGKTSLAVEAMHQAAPAFADGAAFVDLTTVGRAEQVPSAIAQIFGMSSSSGSAAEQLIRLLETRELLLVLDNVEHVVDAASFIAMLAAGAPRTQVLVTSRVRLRVSAEYEFPVQPLHVAERRAPLEQMRASSAIQLFAERARTADPDFVLSEQNLPVVAELCQRLDGLPLAIELAASRLRVLSVPGLLERLDRRLPLLTGGDRDRHPRQHSMRETIAWSYDLLSLEEQRFLRWMSVFAGGLSLGSAEALGHALGLDPDRSLDTVTALVESGLVTRSTPSHAEGRFHLFETIREFGLEQLSASDELDAARMAHTLHFLEFACAGAPRPYDPIPVAWVGRLATEYPNLLAAFDFLCIPETAEQSLQFAAAMGPYWHTRGPFSDWQPHLSRALDLASPEPTVLKVHVLFWMSLIQGTSPNLSEALATASRCVDMANEVGTTSDRAAAIQIMAWVQDCRQQLEIARELREQAMALWTTVGNSYMHAMCLFLNAGAAFALGDLDRAQREAEQAGATFRALGDIDWGAGAAWLQGLLAVAAGRLDLGAAYYEQSIRTWLQSESASRWYRPLIGLADIATAIEQYATAARLLGAADEMLIVGEREPTSFDQPGYARAEAWCREALGDAGFEEYRRAGRAMTPDAWLVEAEAIAGQAARS